MINFIKLNLLKNIRPKFYYAIKAIFLIAVIYIFSSLNNFLPSPIPQFPLLRPASGIAIAAILIFGLKIWPAIFFGYLFYGISSKVPLNISLITASGMSFQAIITKIILDKINFNRYLNTVRDTTSFIFYAALLMPLLGSAVCVSAMATSGIVPPSRFLLSLLTCWIGQINSILVLTPLILVWYGPSLKLPRKKRIFEALLPFLILVIMDLIIFFEYIIDKIEIGPPQHKYTIIPILLWIAYKFRVKGTTLAVFITSTISIWGTIVTSGSIGSDLQLSIIFTQVFVVIISLTFLIFSVIIGQNIETSLRLKKNEKRFRSLIENNPSALLLLDKKGIVSYVSTQAKLLTGYSLASIKDEPFLNKISLEDKLAFKNFFVKLLRNPGNNYLIKNRLMLKNGNYRWVETHGVNMLNEEGVKAIVFNIKDINDQKQLDKVKEEFVSLAAHQLRTPLAIIRWYSEDLKKKFSSNKKVNKQINEIYAAGIKMNETINHLLEVTRMELGMIPIQASVFNIKDVISKVLDNYNILIKRKIIRLYYDKTTNVPDIVGDNRLVEVIIDNLLSNAIKYTPSRGNIFISLLPKRNSILFKIKDSGIGIPKEEKDNLFSKHYRAVNARKIDPSGLGLGLYLIKLIMDFKGGKIWFESKNNNGTTFFAEFPKKIKVR